MLLPPLSFPSCPSPRSGPRKRKKSIPTDPQFFFSSKGKGMITDFPWNLYSIYMYASQRYRQALKKENSELGWHFFFTYPWLILSLSLSLRARDETKTWKNLIMASLFLYTGGGKAYTRFLGQDPPPTLISVPNICIYFYYYLNSWPHKEKREKKRKKKTSSN